MDIIKTLESVVRLGRILMEKSLAEDKLTATEIIACDGLVMPWSPGKYAVGDVRTEAGQTWKCVQAHDSSATPDWTPTATRALWVPYHTKDPKQARPWVAPTMAQDAYYTDEVMLWTNGHVMRAKQDAVVHDPGVLPGAWEDLGEA